jgi:hypothetical protein
MDAWFSASEKISTGGGGGDDGDADPGEPAGFEPGALRRWPTPGRWPSHSAGRTPTFAAWPVGKRRHSSVFFRRAMADSSALCEWV